MTMAEAEPMCSSGMASTAQTAIHIAAQVASSTAGDTDRVALTTGAVISATRMALTATAVPRTVGCTFSTLSA